MNKIFNLIKRDKFLNFTDLIFLSKKANKKIGVYPVSDQSWLDFGQWDEYEKTLKKI